MLQSWTEQMTDDSFLSMSDIYRDHMNSFKFILCSLSELVFIHYFQMC